MPCTAYTWKDQQGPCGKPTLVVEGRPYHKDHCLDCIVISAFLAGQLHAIEKHLPFVVQPILESTPEVVQRFMAQMR